MGYNIIMPSLRSIDGSINLVRVGSTHSCSSAEMDARAHKSSSAKSGPRRGISFNEDVYVQETHHINDFTDEEILRYWFAKRDYQKMKMDFTQTVKLISLGRFSGDTEEHCARGLEYRTREGSHKRKLNKLTALCAVLDEQEWQRHHVQWSDLRISQVYIDANSRCRQISYHLALQDEEFVHGAMLMEPGDDDWDSSPLARGTTVTAAGTTTTHRRSRSAVADTERKTSKHNDPERVRSKSQNVHKDVAGGRIRGFFKRSKDKLDVAVVTMISAR